VTPADAWRDVAREARQLAAYWARRASQLNLELGDALANASEAEARADRFDALADDYDRTHGGLVQE